MSIKLPPRVKPELIYTYKDIESAMGYIANIDQETVLMVTISEKFNIIGEHIISLGTMSQTLLDSRIMMHRVINDKATKFIVGHNHPDGCGSFSEDDIITALKIKISCWCMDIDFIDFLLFPYNREPISFAQRHPKLWSVDMEKGMDNFFKKK